MSDPLLILAPIILLINGVIYIVTAILDIMKDRNPEEQHKEEIKKEEQQIQDTWKAVAK